MISSEDAIDFMIDTNDRDVISYVSTRTDLNERHIQKLFKSKHFNLNAKINIVMNHSITKDQFDEIKDTYSDKLIFAILSNASISLNDKIKMLKSKKILHVIVSNNSSYAAKFSKYKFPLNIKNLKGRIPDDIYTYIEDILNIKDIIE